jgi:hypothetical protein
MSDIVDIKADVDAHLWLRNGVVKRTLPDCCSVEDGPQVTVCETISAKPGVAFMAAAAVIGEEDNWF